MLDFPQQERQDSRFYTVEQEDQAIRTEMEGGYVYSRPRHTRLPRKTYTTGFTSIDDAAKVEIETFYQTVRGGSDAFNWKDPITGDVKTVRLKSPISFSYVGLNGVHLWDITKIELEEV